MRAANTANAIFSRDLTDIVLRIIPCGERASAEAREPTEFRQEAERHRAERRVPDNDAPFRLPESRKKLAWLHEPLVSDALGRPPFGMGDVDDAALLIAGFRQQLSHRRVAGVRVDADAGASVRARQLFGASQQKRRGAAILPVGSHGHSVHHAVARTLGRAGSEPRALFDAIVVALAREADHSGGNDAVVGLHHVGVAAEPYRPR